MATVAIESDLSEFVAHRSATPRARTTRRTCTIASKTVERRHRSRPARALGLHRTPRRARPSSAISHAPISRRLRRQCQSPRRGRSQEANQERHSTATLHAWRRRISRSASRAFEASMVPAPQASVRGRHWRVSEVHESYAHHRSRQRRRLRRSCSFRTRYQCQSTSASPATHRPATTLLVFRRLSKSSCFQSMR